MLHWVGLVRGIKTPENLFKKSTVLSVHFQHLIVLVLQLCAVVRYQGTKAGLVLY